MYVDLVCKSEKRNLAQCSAVVQYSELQLIIILKVCQKVEKMGIIIQYTLVYTSSHLDTDTISSVQRVQLSSHRYSVV